MMAVPLGTALSLYLMRIRERRRNARFTELMIEYKRELMSEHYDLQRIKELRSELEDLLTP